MWFKTKDTRGIKNIGWEGKTFWRRIGQGRKRDTRRLQNQENMKPLLPEATQLSDLSKNPKLDCIFQYTIRTRQVFFRWHYMTTKVCDRLVAPCGGFSPLIQWGSWEDDPGPANNRPPAHIQATINKRGGTLRKSEKMHYSLSVTLTGWEGEWCVAVKITKT